MARLQDHYRDSVVSSLKEQFGYQNPMQVPRLDKIVINMAVGKAVQDSKKLTAAIGDLTKISGQKPYVSKARKSVANFKLREGMNIGCKVTLRKERMYEFLDRLVNITLPRVRDFRGIPTTSFDGRGNYAFGIKDQTVFPEINFDEIDESRGMDVIICTTARTDSEARALLDGFNLPFRK